VSVGGQVATQCVVDILLLSWWQMCAAAGRRACARKLACMFVRTLLAASDVWGRVVVLYYCDGGGGGACFVVLLFVAIGLFIAALAACLCGWLIRSARHGTADNDDGHGDDATCLRVFGGACWAALADVRLGARRRCDRVYILPRGWRVFGCWTVFPEPRVSGVRVVGARVVAGRVGAGGWVGGQVAMQCVVLCCCCCVVERCVASGRCSLAGTSACMFVRTLLAVCAVWGRVVVR
jgi:hypothetical protein